MEEIYYQIDQKIKDSKNIVLVSHKFPDGDTLGSATAMYEMIMTNFEDKCVDIVNSDLVAEKLAFLPNSEKVIQDFDCKKYDLCIFLDIGNLSLAWFWDKDKIKCKNIINIDHHAPNIGYWDINLLDIDMPSTTAVLYHFFNYMWYGINSNIATSLLTWIYTDTWAFVYSNVSTDTFEISSKLVELGGNIEDISSNFFLNNTFEFVKLFWLVLERLKINRDWVALSYLTKKDLLEYCCKYEELDWVVWRLNMLDNVKYVSFFYEKWDLVKCSLRTTRDDVDLNLVAKEYGWWWHKKASAFPTEWNIEIWEDNIFKIRKIDNSILTFF